MGHWIADKIVLMLLYGWFLLKNAQERAPQGHNFQVKPPVITRRRPPEVMRSKVQAVLTLHRSFTYRSIRQGLSIAPKP